MKYLILFLILFIPSVNAKNDALVCTYKTNNNTVTFGYYIDDTGNGKITNFTYSGDPNSIYNNYLKGDLQLECPIVKQIKYYGSDLTEFFITKSEEDFNNLIVNNTLFDKNGYIIGQIENKYESEVIKKFNYSHYESSEIKGSVTEQTRNQMLENIKAYASDDCSYIEKTAIAEYFFANDFDSMNNFYDSNTFKYKNNYIKLNDRCAKNAKNLYNSLFSLRYMLSDYVDSGGDTNTISYLSLQGSFYAGYGALTTPWYNNTTSDNACDAISGDIRKILNELFDTLRLISVILVIFLINLDLIQTLGKKDDSEIKKMVNRSIKRMIALILMLLMPFIINLILDLLNNYLSNSYVNVNGECVKAVTGG